MEIRELLRIWNKIKSYVNSSISGKQDTLVSGTNIKTINNTSLLGSGNISISGGGSNIDVVDNLNSTSTTDALAANQGRELKKMLDEYCPIIEDTRTSGVAAITGVAPFSTLVDGQRIVLHLNYNLGLGATLKLALNGGSETNAFPIYHCFNNSVFAVQNSTAAAGSYLELFFDLSNSRWMISGREINSTYGGITQNQINAGTDRSYALIAPKLLVDNFDKRHLYVNNSADASVELSVATYNDLGTLSAWKPVTLPAAYNRGDEFVFRFECGDASLTPTLPQGVVLADGFDFSEMAVGVTYQVSIVDGIAAYLVLTPNP